MSLLHLDFPSGSPGMYGTDRTRLLNGVYATAGDNFGAVALVEDPDPNVSGTVVRLKSGAGYTPLVRYVLPAAATKVGMAKRMWLGDLPPSNSYLDYVVRWNSAVNGAIAHVRLTTTGRLTIVCGSLTAESINPVVTANAWQHIECIYDGDANKIEVYVEGDLKVSLEDATINATVYQIIIGEVPAVGSAAYSHYQYIKDLVVWDGAGSDNNSQIGTLQVFDLTPVSDVDVGDWTSTGATYYGVLDNAPPVDTDYVATPILPADPLIMTMSDLPDDIVAIRGMITWVRGWKSDGGDGKLTADLSPDNINWDVGAERSLSTAATYYGYVSERSPAGGGVWTPGEVNDLYLRLNRTL